MTSKEKAEELVNKFSHFTVQEKWELKNYYAMECALIAVDEIIKSNPSKDGVIVGGYPSRYLTVDYWEEVKQEIEKL
jgi:hypothetical protein